MRVASSTRYLHHAVVREHVFPVVRRHVPPVLLDRLDHSLLFHHRDHKRNDGLHQLFLNDSEVPLQPRHLLD